MRIAVMTPGRTGYLDTVLQAANALGDDVMVVSPAAHADVAFEHFAMDDFARCLIWDQEPQPDELAAAVDDFRPDVTIMVSWAKPSSYRHVITTRGPGVLRVLQMDNTWAATPKQWLGRATHRTYLDPVFDCVMVPSERTEFFARRLGFDAADVIRGSLSGDSTLFAADPVPGAELAARRSFLSVARLVEHKGADVLAAAYARYRELATDPWELHVAGLGPLAHTFDGIAGVTMHGFVAPTTAARLMHEASCFVLPSRVEPYGVVVHEAATAALPLLCTDWAGANPMFLQDGANGWTVPAGRIDLWAEAMLRMSTQPPERLARMSTISRALSTRLTPQIWAENMHEEFERRMSKPTRRARAAATADRAAASQAAR